MTDHPLVNTYERAAHSGGNMYTHLVHYKCGHKKNTQFSERNYPHDIPLVAQQECQTCTAIKHYFAGYLDDPEEAYQEAIAWSVAHGMRTPNQAQMFNMLWNHFPLDKLNEMLTNPRALAELEKRFAKE